MCKVTLRSMFENNNPQIPTLCVKSQNVCIGFPFLKLKVTPDFNNKIE